ncbi:MAG: hypothetical protein ACFCD0_27920 [Gemmataceae bacterium]
MPLSWVVVLGGVVGAVGLSLLLAGFGAIARLAALHRGCTPENSHKQALARGANNGFRFGLFVGGFGGSLGSYLAGPESFGLELLTEWLFVGVGLVVLAVFFGCLAWRSERLSTTGTYGEVHPLSPLRSDAWSLRADLREDTDEFLQPIGRIIPVWDAKREYCLEKRFGNPVVQS